MKVLCVFTNKYPYTTVEPYLETEILHYGVFDKVYIFSLIVKKSEETYKRNVPGYIEVYPIRNDKLRYIFGSFRALFDSNFYKEIKRLIIKQGISFQRILSLLIYISRSHVDSKKVCRLLKGELADSEALFYTYRFEFQPYTALLVKKKLKLENISVVSRAHGYDLFEERSPGQYIPLRENLLEELHNVYPCSVDGEQYLKNKYPQWSDKISARYLGTNDLGIENYNSSERRFRIVSCSNIIKIKRIDRIIHVLSLLENSNIEWVHFGSGEEEDSIRKMAVTMLNKNINVVFKGRVKNQDIKRYYKEESIDLFINLSDGEGLPVSIMEAFSFGIPCIATDVGGTSEIVTNGVNGYLVNVDNDDAEIARVISEVINMDERKYMLLRSEARKTWENKFNAEKNYRDFLSELLKTLSGK